MKYSLMTINGLALEIDQGSYEAFCRDSNDEKILFHNFRDNGGAVHTMAKSVILSVAMDSGIKKQIKL